MLQNAVIGDASVLDSIAYGADMRELIYTMWSNFGCQAVASTLDTSYVSQPRIEIRTKSGLPAGYLGLQRIYTTRSSETVTRFYVDSPFVNSARSISNPPSTVYSCRASVNLKRLIDTLKSASLFGNEKAVFATILPDSTMYSYAVRQAFSNHPKAISLSTSMQLSLIVKELGVGYVHPDDARSVASVGLTRADIEQAYSSYRLEQEEQNSYEETMSRFSTNADVVCVLRTRKSMQMTYVLFRDVTLTGDNNLPSYTSAEVFHSWEDVPDDIAVTFAIIKAGMESSEYSQYKDDSVGTGIKCCDKYFKELDVLSCYRNRDCQVIAIAK